MQVNENNSKSKALLKTVGLLLIAFALNVVFNVFMGDGIREAVLLTLSGLKPFEAIVLGIVLYLSVTGRLHYERRVSLTSLDLKNKDGR